VVVIPVNGLDDYTPPFDRPAVELAASNADSESHVFAYFSSFGGFHHAVK
jgi:hypothetical protein